MYKFVYNVTNIVADKCREIEQLNEKKVIAELDWSYTADNNIGKHDVFCHPNRVPITTTQGSYTPRPLSQRYNNSRHSDALKCAGALWR